ncbi:hypothetical protein [Specibacter cremeus]|uniref:hypothetical protein n=1 Tax=Specibacter cremeus TaxID=1629051 RepID=UPI000F794621|nr:hypothetical protein [Specibacter cremeus]
MAPTDDRYPAIYQRGGDDLPRTAVAPPAAFPTAGAPPAEAPPAVEAVPVVDAVPAADAPGPDPDQPDADGPRPAPWRAGRARVLLILAAALVAAGVACLTIQYWLPASLVMDPAALHGIAVSPWGPTVAAAAPHFMGAGVGLGVAVLFFAARNRPAADRSFRATALAWALALVAAGLWAMFTPGLFPDATMEPQLHRLDGGGAGLAVYAMPWPYAVSSVATALLAPGLALAAVVVVLPPAGPARPSPHGAWLAGGALVLLGFAAIFAPHLTPLSMGTEPRTLGELTYSMAPWPTVLQGAAPACLIVGLGVIVWGTLGWAAPGPDPDL